MTAPPPVLDGRSDASGQPAADAPAAGAGPGPWGRWWRRWLGRIFVVGSALWLVFVLVHLALRGRVWWWLLAELLPPITFLAVPVLFAAAAAGCRRTRRPAALLSAAALLAGIGMTGVNLPGPLRGAGQVPADALRIVSWNTGYWHPPGRADDFYRLLRAQRADVYLLQEYLAEVDGEFVPIDDLARLRRELPGYHVAMIGELVTLSRFPIVESTPLEAPDAPPPPTDFTDFWQYQVLRVDVRVGDRVLSTYNAHLPVPVWVGGPSVWSAEFHRTIRDQRERRLPQLRVLADDVAANDNPIVVAGDLNMTSVMGDTRRLPSELRDAVSTNRSFYPASWPTEQTSLWRLDWVLVSDGVAVHRYEFGDPDSMSDHRPQLVSVSL
ncbi:endonuclease/exonuclease/phosphatase family protein [Solwaraspora sp. WMMD406]|uniref:endonuclease/exonuclease/phosphatase family protein n=1 Tax=Solwaraspora sp. WMMD406 TaxID=3016095 RepID=UPI0024172335|nr:endonuclease/exonuclease/phosphatase family protein [Solwaraspora sp. WMMD406]MDG4766354.1 endonuclease/exonuclease/phosphatase family protein [Solwaraspora sp. WMMD406]